MSTSALAITQTVTEGPNGDGKTNDDVDLPACYSDQLPPIFGL